MSSGKVSYKPGTVVAEVHEAQGGYKQEIFLDRERHVAVGTGLADSGAGDGVLLIREDEAGLAVESAEVRRV